MAGLLYLPRIFVYHSEADHESQKKVFKTMEKKLYNLIMMPAMFLSGFLVFYCCTAWALNIFELWIKLRLLPS